MQFKNILVFAGTEQPENAIARAIDLAIENNAKLTLMDVVKPIPKMLSTLENYSEPAALENLVVADRSERLFELAVGATEKGLSFEVVVAVGNPAIEVTLQVIKRGHDIVVKNADCSKSLGMKIFGGVAKTLLRVCPCPVLLLRVDHGGPFRSVVSAIDVESKDKTHADLNSSILEHGFSISQKERAQFHIVAAWNLWMEDAMRRYTHDDSIEKLRREHEAKAHGLLDELLQSPNSVEDDIHLHFRKGPSVGVIQNVIRETHADLLVMGTICRIGIAGWMIGNTAESIVTDIPCSLLAIKPDGFVSPIAHKPDQPVITGPPFPLI